MLDKILRRVRRKPTAVVEECTMIRLPNGKSYCVKQILQSDNNSITFIDSTGRIRIVKW